LARRRAARLTGAARADLGHDAQCDGLARLQREIASRTTWFDGATFSHPGTPTIGLEPEAFAAAHAVDEFVPLDELVRGAQVLAVLAMRFCGVEPH
jgi:acetylornithine deacetylase/succinyl-diaminopimelate desuccinylase-like protein